MTLTGPDTYTHGLGELIRSHRLYMCITRDEMAARLNMNPRTYERIEAGQRECPPGLLDTLRGVLEDFERDVDRVADNAPGEVKVSGFPSKSWERAVAGRASVETAGAIIPVLVK